MMYPLRGYGHNFVEVASLLENINQRSLGIAVKLRTLNIHFSCNLYKVERKTNAMYYNDGSPTGFFLSL
jgi:hypothetical protein